MHSAWRGGASAPALVMTQTQRNRSRRPIGQPRIIFSIKLMQFIYWEPSYTSSRIDLGHRFTKKRAKTSKKLSFDTRNMRTIVSETFVKSWLKSCCILGIYGGIPVKIFLPIWCTIQFWKWMMENDRKRVQKYMNPKHRFWTFWPNSNQNPVY